MNSTTDVGYFCGSRYPQPTVFTLLRSTAVLKGYVCVVICMVTKAMHLELVSDLSTETLLVAFKGFNARRCL